MKYIFVRKKDLPLNPKTPLDYGCYLKIRNDPEVIAKAFGSLERFITKDGKVGIFPHEKYYVFVGELNDIDIPPSLNPDIEKTLQDFVDQVKQNISVRLSKKICSFNKESFENILLNTNNKYDDIKKEIKLSIREVTKEYKNKKLQHDPRLTNCQLFNSKQYQFINNVSRSCKLYLNNEKKRYDVEVSHFKDQMDSRKVSYFQTLIKEHLDEIFPKSRYFNWCVKSNAKLQEPKYVMNYDSSQIYKSKVEIKVKNDKKIELTLDNILESYPNLKSYVQNVSNNAPYNTFVIIKGKVDITKFVDLSKSLKEENKVVTFSNFENGEVNYKYKDKMLFENDVNLGKFKLKQFDNVIVLIKKI